MARGSSAERARLCLISSTKAASCVCALCHCLRLLLFSFCTRVCMPVLLRFREGGIIQKYRPRGGSVRSARSPLLIEDPTLPKRYASRDSSAGAILFEYQHSPRHASAVFSSGHVVGAYLRYRLGGQRQRLGFSKFQHLCLSPSYLIGNSIIAAVRARFWGFR